MPPWASRHIGGSWSVPTIHRCPQAKAVGSPKSTRDDYDPTTRLKHFVKHSHASGATFVKHLHASGAGSLRPRICEATTELGDNTFRNPQEVPQEVPQEIPQEIPQENSEQHPDHTFKVIKTLNLLDQYIKKLILGDCEVTDDCSQDLADIVKVKDTIEELELPLQRSTRSLLASPLKRLRKRRRPSTM